MDANELEKKTKELIVRDFGLEAAGIGGEGILLQVLAERIADLITHQPEYLFSLLYRLDVPEEEVHRALMNVDEKSPDLLLAELVLKRQKKRIETRMNYQPPPLDDEMAW